MLETKTNYSELYDSFRWPELNTFNIAQACVDVWAATEPERLAIIDVDDNDQATMVSYGVLRDRAERLAAALSSLGVKRGDRVAIMVPQCADAPAIHMAVYKLAAIAVPLSLMFGPDAAGYRIADSGARVLITPMLVSGSCVTTTSDLTSWSMSFRWTGLMVTCSGFETLLSGYEPGFEHGCDQAI